jgi:hypothetical protein
MRSHCVNSEEGAEVFIFHWKEIMSAIMQTNNFQLVSKR